MMFLAAREASKLWRKISTETGIEVKLLLENWKLLLAGLIFQYIHGLAARGIHYLHQPGPILQDIGFIILPELGKDRGYISESLFSFLFMSFVLWTFNPFVFQSKRFYTVHLWCRVLTTLVACQLLRIITFYSTQLPGPNYHCREGSSLARLPRPDNLLEVLLLNFPRGVIYGCGDLIFSSHTIFTLIFVLTYQKYGSKRWIKRLAWFLAVIQSLLIIASRKHYTVDVVVAWYTVNLVVFFIDKKIPEMDNRSTVSSPLLPLISNGRESREVRSKDENISLLNGKNIHPVDRKQRNGKISDNTNRSEKSPNDS